MQSVSLHDFKHHLHRMAQRERTQQEYGISSLMSMALFVMSADCKVTVPLEGAESKVLPLQSVRRFLSFFDRYKGGASSNVHESLVFTFLDTVLLLLKVDPNEVITQGLASIEELCVEVEKQYKVFPFLQNNSLFFNIEEMAVLLSQVQRLSNDEEKEKD